MEIRLITILKWKQIVKRTQLVLLKNTVKNIKSLIREVQVKAKERLKNLKKDAVNSGHPFYNHIHRSLDSFDMPIPQSFLREG